MPLCYGGGLKLLIILSELLLWRRKVCLGSVVIDDPGLIELAAQRVGGQSIVAVMDVKKTGLLVVMRFSRTMELEILAVILLSWHSSSKPRVVAKFCLTY